MATFQTHFKKLINEWKLNENEVVLVEQLKPENDTFIFIYKRNDNNQYIYIEHEYSYTDDEDDYFWWNYITEKQKNKLIKNYGKL